MFRKRGFSFLMMFLIAVALGGFGGSGGGGGSSAPADTSGGGGGGDGGGGGGGTGGTYSGAAKVSGTIKLSSLSSADNAILGKAMGKKPNGQMRSAFRATDWTVDAKVKLYVVGANGELEDTGITCSFKTPDAAGNPTYECDGVKDGINYIVRYVKLAGEGKALELKANVDVPDGATTLEQEMSPETSVVVGAIVSAILDATSGSGIDQDVVSKIVDAVKNAILTLVDSGAIQIPSMVVDVTNNDIDAVLGEDIKNDDMDNVAGQIIADDDVDSNLGTVKGEVQSVKFDMSGASTDAEKLTLIQRVFREMMDGEEEGGVPQFMVQFFADKFIANITIKSGELIDSIIAGFEYKNIFQSDMPGDVSKSGGVAGFNTDLAKMYDLYDKRDAGTLTAEEKKKLAEIPPVLLGLFPRAEKSTWTAITLQTPLNVPQAIAFTIYFMDVYIKSAFEREGIESTVEAQQGDGNSVTYEKKDPIEFNPMKPGSLMQKLGFYEDVLAGKYSGVDIFELWLHPGRTWVETTAGSGKDVDMMSAGVCWMDITSLVQQFVGGQGGSVDVTGYSVSLTYPKKGGGTGTVDLMSEAELDGRQPDLWNNCWIIDPWREAWASQQQQPGGTDGGGANGGTGTSVPKVSMKTSARNVNVQPDASRIISDFTSGDYVVVVSKNGTEQSRKTFNKKVITGMTDAIAKLTSPKGAPIWPGWDATQAETDAFNQAWQTYEETNYSANVMCSTGLPPATGETADCAKVTISWEPPVIDLPDGVKMVYRLDVGKSGCDVNGCIWEPIWNSWEQNKRIFTTSFTIPTAIPELPAGSTLKYNVNLGIEFIDQSTGEMLGNGGNSWAEFRVAKPIDKAATFTITGNVSIVNGNDNSTMNLSDVTGLTAALVTESCDPDKIFNPCSRTIIKSAPVVAGVSGNTYTLVPTIGDFLGSKNNWKYIVVWEDRDLDGTIDESPTEWESTWWPDWQAGNVWFETWGGILRVRHDQCETNGTCTSDETVVLGGESVTGPSFNVMFWPMQTTMH
ncbi:MAG: hypothetical protein HZA20_02340 [Nitrospirae bacterium]|nr:hypothetical protein [Nitrospirota bacterium]